MNTISRPREHQSCCHVLVLLARGVSPACLAASLTVNGASLSFLFFLFPFVFHLFRILMIPFLPFSLFLPSDISRNKFAAVPSMLTFIFPELEVLDCSSNVVTSVRTAVSVYSSSTLITGSELPRAAPACNTSVPAQEAS